MGSKSSHASATQPECSAGGKYYGKQVGRNADRFEDDARVKVDIGIEVALNEVVIFGALFALVLGDG